ncbi:spore germination protein GerPE [Rossellomorea marisflavi]|uniref:spore germination protein GerPE n=1 Tax=Rossellomorea marisflavi TaxID=189381 RepID=UPI0035152F9F
MRYSIVNQLEGITLAFSSFYQIGDSRNIDAVSWAYAVQREKEFYLSSEGSYDYRVFQAPLQKAPIDPRIKVSRLSLCPIKVDRLFVKATAFSSIVHIGNVSLASMEGRIKHIRQLEDAKEGSDQTEEIEEPN